MEKYYIIPAEYSSYLLDIENSLNNNGFVLTGVFKREGVFYFNTVLYTIVEGEVVPKDISLYNIFNVPTKELIAFTLQGDLDLYEPAFKTTILALEGVLEFTDSETYIEYVNSLTIT